ncbi:MAG: cation:proton antiporter [candidate division WOR-3 bacterium]
MGFISDIIFKRFSIPPTLSLLTVGFILTNIFHLFDSEMILIFAPYFGTMAFAIILFEGGLALDIYSLVKKLGIAFLFGTLIFLLTAISLAIFWILFGGDPYIGAIIGIMLGGISGAIVIPIISKLKVSEEVKTVAKMEAVLAEIYIIVGVSVILGMIKGEGDFNIPSYFFNSIVNSTLIGIFVGLVWLQAIKFLVKNEIYYILTLAVLFGTYWFVEFIHANGPLAALVLGMVISNTEKVVARVLPFLRIDEERVRILNFSIDEFTRQVSVELSFVFSTFFFLILGMVVKLDYLLDWNVLSAIFGFSLIIIIIRAFVTFLVYLIDKDIKRNREVLTLFFMMPRGLVTAIVAFNVGSVLPQYANLLLSYAFGVILVSVIIMTFGIFLTRYFVGGEQ